MGVQDFSKWTQKIGDPQLLDFGLTIEAVLVQVSQRCYGTAEPCKDFKPIQLGRLEVPRGSLQRH